MSKLIEQSIERKRQEAIRTGVALVKLLTPEEAAFWREKQRQAVNAKARRSYARNRTKEIADQIRKQKTPEGKAAKLFLNTLARARRWRDEELETALLNERTQKGKAASVDVQGIMRRLGRGRKWRVKPVHPEKPKEPRKKRPSKFSQLTGRTIFQRTKGGETALHRAIKAGKLSEVPLEALSLVIIMTQNDLGRTPLHYAAHFGCLNLVPPEFLTQQTLSVRNSGGNTPVHIAAQDGHLHQIPHKLLTTELMSMENNSGASPQSIVEWRARPASDRQRAFLTDLGASFSPSISVTEASTLITETMQSSPVSQMQAEKLRRLGFKEAVDRMTAAEAREKIDELIWKRATDDQFAQAEQLGLIIKNPRKINAGSLDEMLKLADRPASSEQLAALQELGIQWVHRTETALTVFLIIELAKTYASWGIVPHVISEACRVARKDPDFRRPMVLSDLNLGSLKPSATVRWPKEKLQYWSSAPGKSFG